jgi:murein DD-endopeptidase MepM/ murein hydrolase activator NlpD
VIIDDGQGHRALYAHLSKIEVTAGQPVTPDTLIGAVGATGCTSGPHLHFGLQVDGQVVDPTAYIKDEGLS